MDSYTIRDNKFDPKFRKILGTSHLILDIYLRIVSILITPVRVHPRTGYEGPGQEKYRYTLYLISTLEGCGWSTPRPGRFTLGKRSDSHCTGGWVGARAGPDGVHKARPHREANPGPFSPKRVAIQITLCRPTGIPEINETQKRKIGCE